MPLPTSSNVQAYGRTLRGIAGFALKRKDGSNEILHLPLPSDFTIETGAEEEAINAMNPLGQGITIGSIERAVKPTLSLTYGVHQPDIYEFIFGRRFTAQIEKSICIKQYTVRASLVEPEVPVGSLGYGYPADLESCHAAVKDDFGQSYQLTRVPWASTPGDTEFAQGPNMAVKFGPNLVDATVTLLVDDGPEETVLSLSEEPSPFFEMRALFVDNTNECVILNAESVKAQVGGRSIAPMTTDVSLSFFMHGLPGRCDPGFGMRWTGRKVAC
jgi:hypothetical protein